MTRDEMVERLELERLGGMPRWHAHPVAVITDPLPVLAARRREVAAAVRHEGLDGDQQRRIA